MRQRAKRKKTRTAPPAVPPAMARTWACVKDVDGTGVGVEVGEDVGLAARPVVLEDKVVLEELVAEEVVAEEDVFEVELAAAPELVAALELVDVTEANAVG